MSVPKSIKLERDVWASLKRAALLAEPPVTMRKALDAILRKALGIEQEQEFHEKEEQCSAVDYH